MFRRIILLVALLFVQNIYAVPKEILERIIDDRTKKAHIKADEIDQRIASAFVNAGYVWANYDSRYKNFVIRQHKYPEPIVLSVRFSEEIRKDLITEGVQYDNYCEINAFVNFDREQKRFMFKTTEIICGWDINVGRHESVRGKFKANIKGKVFGVDFKDGLKVDSELNPHIESDVYPKIGSGDGMYIYFEKHNSKGEQQHES
ncbi:MAG: hypothetical protein HRT87_09635 [Legionellales bacterium]|nr:hypothetical protein [Legionellales bacterium]